MTAKAVLNLKNVSVHFGGIKAISEVNLHLNEGEILALIGPNGAGKTTAFNAITGVYQPTFGTITAFGKSTAGLLPNQITGLGLARTFQNIRLFQDLSVRDNILIALDRTTKNHILSAILRTPQFLEQEEQKNKKVDELLEIFSLSDIS